MTRMHRLILVTFVATAAFGCGKKPPEGGGETTATAAPAPPPTAAPVKTEKPVEKPAPKPEAEKPAAEADAGFHWEVHKPTNIKFELPKEWTTSINGDVLVAKTPTQGVGLEFVGTEGKLSAKADEKALLKEVGRSLQKAKITEKPKAVEQHGLKGHITVGKGYKDGKEVEWFCSVLGDGKGKDMLTLGFYLPHLGEKYKKEMLKVLDSISKAN